ncbi:MAG: hypothetical protein LQ352_007214, partial [Teloschistes flavicans]
MHIAPSPTNSSSFPASSSPDSTSITSEDAFLPFPLSKSQRTKTNSDAQGRQDRAAAIQTAKREVLANIRHDWTWPPPLSPSQSDSFPRRRESTQWRERGYDSPPEATGSPSPIPPDPYKFESPDAVGAAAKPSKRRKLSNDEVEWNTGLKTFIARRDYWTGAERRSLRKDSGGLIPGPSTTASNDLLETEASRGTEAATPLSDPPTSTSSSLEETASTSPTSTDSLTAPSTSQASSTLEPAPTPQSSTQGCSFVTTSD